MLHVLVFNLMKIWIDFFFIVIDNMNSLDVLIEQAKNKKLNWALRQQIVNKAMTVNLNTLKNAINKRPDGLNSIRANLKKVYVKRYINNKAKTFEKQQLEYSKGDPDIKAYLFWGIRIGLQNLFTAEAKKITLKPPMTLKVHNSLKETSDEFPSVTLEIFDENKKLVTYLNCEFTGPWDLILANGETFSHHRQGWGLFIRALAIYLAKKTGKIKYIHQVSKNTKGLRPGKRPPSALLMNKLGFNRLPGKDPSNNTLEFRGLNMNRTNVNTIVRNRIMP